MLASAIVSLHVCAVGCDRRRLRSTKGLLRSGGNCAKCTPAECHPQYLPKSAEGDSSAACIAVFTVTGTVTATEENRKSVKVLPVATTRINLIASGLARLGFIKFRTTRSLSLTVPIEPGVQVAASRWAGGSRSLPAAARHFGCWPAAGLKRRSHSETLATAASGLR